MTTLTAGIVSVPKEAGICTKCKTEYVVSKNLPLWLGLEGFECYTCSRKRKEFRAYLKSLGLTGTDASKFKLPESNCSKCNSVFLPEDFVYLGGANVGPKCSACHEGKDRAEQELTFEQKQEIQGLKDRLSCLQNLRKPLAPHLQLESDQGVEQLNRYKMVQSVEKFLRRYCD